MSTTKKNLNAKEKIKPESSIAVVEESGSVGEKQESESSIAIAEESGPVAETIETSLADKPKTSGINHTFHQIRNIKEAPMHVTESFAEKPVPKSYSLYQQDLERIENFKETLKTKSRGRLYDSLIVRVALAYLQESYDKGGKQFDKDIKRLISENR